MKHVFWAIALLLWPLSSFGQQWYSAPKGVTIVPYQRDARNQAGFEAGPNLSCFVGWMERNRAVVFYAWEKQAPIPVKNKPNTVLEQVHFIEAVLDAESAKLREANLGKFNLPHGIHSPDFREGKLDFRKHPCLSRVETIPSPHVRDVMVRFRKNVEKNPNDIHVQ